MSYHELLQWRGCTECDLHEQCFSHVVFNGSTRASTLVLTYFPDEDDDALGESCSGRKRTVFNSLIAQVKMRTGLRLFPCYAPRVACKPTGSSRIRKEHLDACLPRVDQIVDMINPHLIIEYGKRPQAARYKTDIPTIQLPTVVYECTTEDQLMAFKRNVLLIVEELRKGDHPG